MYFQLIYVDEQSFKTLQPNTFICICLYNIGKNWYAFSTAQPELWLLSSASHMSENPESSYINWIATLILRKLLLLQLISHYCAIVPVVVLSASQGVYAFCNISIVVVINLDSMLSQTKMSQNKIKKAVLRNSTQKSSIDLQATQCTLLWWSYER